MIPQTDDVKEQQEKSQTKDIFRKVVYLKTSLFTFVQIYSIINVPVLPPYCSHQNICLITSEKVSNNRNTFFDVKAIELGPLNSLKNVFPNLIR